MSVFLFNHGYQAKIFWNARSDKFINRILYIILFRNWLVIRLFISTLSADYKFLWSLIRYFIFQYVIYFYFSLFWFFWFIFFINYSICCLIFGSLINFYLLPIIYMTCNFTLMLKISGISYFKWVCYFSNTFLYYCLVFN